MAKAEPQIEMFIVLERGAKLHTSSPGSEFFPGWKRGRDREIEGGREGERDREREGCGITSRGVTSHLLDFQTCTIPHTAEDMDISPPALGYSTQPQWQSQRQAHWGSLSSGSDSEFYSMSSPEAISPASPAGCGFSSPCPSYSGSVAGVLSRHSGSRHSPASPPGISSGGKARRNRAKNPSKQRQSASEKEKLRMRALTKALHHLRTYLPPSLAPAGQTLTKIQTLRLTIHYISHLSAQLEPMDGAPSWAAGTGGDAMPQNPPEIQGCFQYTPVSEFWSHGPQELGQNEGLITQEHPLVYGGLECSRFNTALELSPQGCLFNSSSNSPLQSQELTHTTESCQMYSEDFCNQNIPPLDYWI
ncbi:hypothetical protein JZ751_015346 [Albula glossodonta]|uniref:BHLH domain-containing protein n=1 Tax=Albula glossodonta TaxID=121402 RepID=A0A8T2MVE5_9TELE|nr:hypothetical protein JZ751_015346 [Albula glossodonta]